MKYSHIVATIVVAAIHAVAGASPAPADAYETDDLRTQAKSISNNQSHSHILTANSDVDWIRFKAPSSAPAGLFDVRVFGVTTAIRADLWAKTSGVWVLYDSRTIQHGQIVTLNPMQSYGTPLIPSPIYLLKNRASTSGDSGAYRVQVKRIGGAPN